MDYKYLEYLRNNSHLSIIEKIKVNKLRKLAMEKQHILNTLGRCKLGADFTDADNLEYQLRLRRFAYDLIPLWDKYNDGLSLYDFAERVIRDNKDKKQVKRLIRR